MIKPEAESDFIEIRDRYEDVSNGSGTRFFLDLTTTLEKIKRNPQYCFNVGHGYRRANIQDFPYSVYFQKEEKRVIIFGIFHQHRDPKEWQKRTIKENKLYKKAAGIFSPGCFFYQWHTTCQKHPLLFAS
ncbi:MAG TPA: type II toxin-antitoxin system RelE/ParE family toxin [Phnomibacter sp.]|nr:type II toxin-antitoxin system RelE/ParE family toxin [Phnomibacter sp.]